MEYLRRIYEILHKPFPVEESKVVFYRIIIFISLFIFLFLGIFEPFGIHTLDRNKWGICLGFGITAFLTMTAFEYLMDLLFKLKRVQEKYTFWKWMLYMLGMMMAISLTNFLYSRSLFGYIDWSLFPVMMKGTVAIGIFPIIFLGGAALLRTERKYQDISKEINEKPAKPHNRLDDELVIFEIPVNDVLYVEALQNYVKIGHLDAHGSFAERTERSTLKNILDQVKGSSIIKCHRSYLVNTEAILHTTGNAQGLQLKLNHCDNFIPVSRSFVSSFRK